MITTAPTRNSPPTRQGNSQCTRIAYGGLCEFQYVTVKATGFVNAARAAYANPLGGMAEVKLVSRLPGQDDASFGCAQRHTSGPHLSCSPAQPAAA
jgi:hypothetical protein